MNRTNYLLAFLLFALAPVFGMGQSLQPVNGLNFPNSHPIQQLRAQGPAVHARTANCGPDTVLYTLNKGSGIRALLLNNSTSASAGGQYFDAPQSITISGFQFHGWAVSQPLINVTCAIYLAGPDSLPTGAPLTTTTVPVDSSFGGGALAFLVRNVTFPVPVTVSAPYVLVVENNSSSDLGLISNDYLQAEGQGENLGSAQVFGTWIQGLDLNVGGSPFDADWLFSPIVSYQLTADFAANPTCILNPNTTVNFTNGSSPILGNRMYNVAAFLGIPGASYTWDFGDGSPFANGVNASHVYANTGNYTVTLTDTLFGWTSLCFTNAANTLGGGPTAAFNSTANGLQWAFADASSGGPIAWLWDFGDGATSTSQNPAHTYASPGVYTVCLTADGGGCPDSTCSQITVSAVPTGQCGPDTVEYPLAKATSLTALSINNTSSAPAVGQYFDAPQPITISGFDIYAWSTFLPSVNVICQLYAAGPDSLPTGAPLASAIVPVDSNFYGGNLNLLRKIVSFNVPVTLSSPYVVVLENASPNSVAVVSNDNVALPPDGRAENLSSFFLGGNWIHGLDVNVNGSAFDADFLFHPHASYILDADFAATPVCLPAPGTQVDFTNLSSPIFQNRMYNQAVFFGAPSASYTWDFGDGSATVNAVDTNHVYPATGPYTVSLADTLFGWRTLCTETATETLNPGAAAAFSLANAGLTVSVTDQSTGFPTSWLWDFGDGTTSTLPNPGSHTYASSGTYTVCLVVTSPSCSDTTCQTVTVFTAPVAGCGIDTVRYPFFKATTARSITISSSSATGAGQYYNAPQPITVYGFEFFAWSDVQPIQNVTASVYLAGPDSLPTGAPLVSVVVPVDSNFGGGNLAVLQKTVNFPNPVTVTQPYVITIENSSANDVNLLSNDYTIGNGQGENLSSVLVGGTWLDGLSITVGGNAFDADWLMHPVVGYGLSSFFTTNPPCVLAGGNVAFTNGSSPILFDRMYNIAVFLGQGALSSFWNFGDGSPGVYGVDTSHTYAANGPFTVTLSDTLYTYAAGLCTADTSLLLQGGPVAAFNAAGSSLNWSFQDQSVLAGPASYLWDFGDGTSSVMQNPNHTYPGAGTYLACLTVTDACGSDSTCSSILVLCPDPSAAFSFSTNLLTATFTDQSTATTTISSWLWDFGDGNTSTQQNPSHTYAAAGNYTVCLTVTDTCGTDSICTNVTIVCPPPVAAFNINGSLLTYNFTDQSSSSNAISAWFWDFGDGNTSTQQNPSHSYAASGVYTVCLTVTDICGSDSACSVLTVVCPPPTAAFNASGSLLTYNFTDQSSSSNTLTSWLWDFGDGTTSTQQNPSHSYPAAGSYTACLTVTDSCGSDSACSVINVVCPPPAAAFSLSSSSLFTYNFTDQSSSSNTISSWFWDFGDGTTTTQQNPSHTYSTAGTYFACLTVTDVCGSDSACAVITITCPAPSAAFSFSGSLLSYNFTDQSSSSQPIASWFWDFGDGNTSTQQNPSHSYGSGGNYTVCLVVASVCGFDSTCIVVNVNCPNPTAAFGVSTTGLTAGFTDQSSSPNTIGSWNWDFGDGNTSTAQNPAHTYGLPGTYFPCLTVTDPCGFDVFCDTVVVDTPVGISNGLAYQLELYPNPVRDELTVAIGLERSSDVVLRIYNGLGQFIRESKHELVGAEKVRLDVSDLADGSYFIEVEIGEGKETLRFSIMR